MVITVVAEGDGDGGDGCGVENDGSVRKNLFSSSVEIII